MDLGKAPVDVKRERDDVGCFGIFRRLSGVVFGNVLVFDGVPERIEL